MSRCEGCYAYVRPGDKTRHFRHRFANRNHIRAARERSVLMRRARGETRRHIADHFAVTIERIRQIESVANRRKQRKAIEESQRATRRVLRSLRAPEQST